MCDGNRRPNYDGCLLPPVFIGPGDPYSTPETHRLTDFFKRPEHPTTFKGGKGTWKDYRTRALHPDSTRRPSTGRDADADAKNGLSKSEQKTGVPGKRRKEQPRGYLGGRPRNQNGLFSAIYDSDPPRKNGETAIGFRQPTKSRRDGASGKPGKPRDGRFKTDAEYRENVGRGEGGLFSGTGTLGPSDSPKAAPSEPPIYRGERREYFDPNPYGSAGLDAQSRPPPDLDIKKYQSMDMPGRGVYRDSRNWTNTFDRFPAHTSDTYSDPAYRKGLKEGQSMFYTYQNKTRTAYADTHGVADVGGESWSQKRINNSKGLKQMLRQNSKVNP